MLKKILILGAKGMLGSDLMKEFEDIKPIGWDIEDIDITDEKDVKKKIGSIKPQVIINAAAYTNVDNCEINKDLAMKVNGYAVGLLAQISKETQAILVHYSTDYVFSGDKKEGYKEDDKPGPTLNIYGESKLLGERLLRKNANKYYLIRTSWLYGKNGKNFVNTILKLSCERDIIKVVCDQYGRPTYTVDLVRRTNWILGKSLPFGIYHITNRGRCSWYEFAKEIIANKYEGKEGYAKVTPVKTQEFPRPAKRPRYSELLNTKLPKMRHWREALKEYLSELENYPEGITS